jgi:hypothetical protein
MTIEITEEQRQQIAGILATHIHNMQTAFIAAHGSDQKRAEFDETRLRVTEILVPFFALPEAPDDHEEQDISTRVMWIKTRASEGPPIRHSRSPSLSAPLEPGP